MKLPSLRISFGEMKEMYREFCEERPYHQELVSVVGYPLLSRGDITAVTGHTGDGHTSLCDIVMSAALGQPFGDIKAIQENLRVMYIDTQHGRPGWERTCWRLSRMRGIAPMEYSTDRLKFMYCGKEEAAFWHSISNAVYDFKPDLVVIDTFESVARYTEDSFRKQYPN